MEPASVSVHFTGSLTRLSLVWLPRRPDKSPRPIMLRRGLVPNRYVWIPAPKQLCSYTFKTVNNQ